jgi:hypothetical protein
MEFSFSTVEDVKDYIINHSVKYANNKKGWNLDNTEFLTYILDRIGKGYWKKTTLDKFLGSLILGRTGKVRCSVTSVEYFTAIGWDKVYAAERVTEKQRSSSKLCIEYWLNRGYSVIDAENKIRAYQSANGKNAWQDKVKMKTASPVYKEHWLEKGYSAAQAVRKVNPSCKDYYGYNSETEYDAAKKRNSDRIKKLWSEGVYDGVVNIYEGRRVSKEEIEFFTHLASSIFNVEHVPFGINLRKVSDDLKYTVYDGYIPSKEGVILVEYDGTYWHDPAKDFAKDELVLQTRPDIIGIIRVNDKFFKKNKNKNFVSFFEDGIKEIKSNKSKRILLTEGGS